MHYYVYAALIFKDGQVVSGINQMYATEKPATMIEFHDRVALWNAGPPDIWDAIIITCWQELDEATYQYMYEKFGERNELTEKGYEEAQKRNQYK